eukprot:759003-Hanusia_phi.AAC.3
MSAVLTCLDWSQYVTKVAVRQVCCLAQRVYMVREGDRSHAQMASLPQPLQRLVPRRVLEADFIRIKLKHLHVSKNDIENLPSTELIKLTLILDA